MNYVDYSDYIIGSHTLVKTNKGDMSRIYFDNGATTLIFKSVVEKLNDVYSRYTYTDLSNYNSERITEEYNEARDVILDYLGATKGKDTVLFVKNSTEALNTFSNAILEEDPEQIVLTTKMEHLANYLPYKERMKTELIELTEDGNVDMEDYNNKMEMYKGKVKYVCVTGASNVTGIIPPFYEMAEIAHEYGAKILVDIVQLLQHRDFSMLDYDNPQHIDFVVFSAHKCYSGLDGGALIGPADMLNKYIPLQVGAGITKFVNSNMVIYDDVPDKYEPGYPDVLGVIATATALKTLKKIGLDTITKREYKLYSYLLKGLRKFPNIIIYGVSSGAVGIPFLSFTFCNISSKEIVKKLGYDYGIEMTSGTIGANIYVQSLLGFSDDEAYEYYQRGIPYGVIRVSLGFYNSIEEIDRLLCALNNIV